MDSISVVIPKSVENLNLPDPELVNFFSDLENRSFWIDEEVSTYLLEVVKYIIKWNAEDKDIPVEERKPIKLFFFSPGGDLDINYSIIDIIKLSKTPVIGVNVGQCASAAAYIYLACHKRYMLPHAYFLYHQGSGVLSGSFGEICAQMEDYQQQVEELANFLAQHTNYEEEEIAEKIIGEWYIRKDEALEKGIVHAVVTDLSMLI